MKIPSKTFARKKAIENMGNIIANQKASSQHGRDTR